MNPRPSSPARSTARRAQTRRPSSTPAQSWRAWLAAAALLGLVCIAYAPVGDAGFIWDDDSYVTGNATLRSLDGLRRIWFEIGAVPQYYPLVHTTFWIEYHLWGLAPLGYHVVNVLLHAVSVLLLWRLLRRLNVPGAWWAAALFAVHPVMVESVAWVTERKNVLSLALSLGAMLSYLRFSPLENEEVTATDVSHREGMRWGWYALALSLFLAALLSKTVVASLPAVILVIVWWKRGTLSVRDLVPLLPFFASGIGCGLFTAWMEKHHVGAAGLEWNFSPADRVLIAGRSLWFYAAKLAFPYPLAFFYPRFNIDDHVWWQYLFPLTALTLVVGLWLARSRIGRGPLAGVLIFGGVLTPALGLVDVYPMRFSFVADHFQYHASIALLTLAVAAVVHFLSKLRADRKSAGAAVAVVAVVTLVALSMQRSAVFQNVDRLYRDTIAKNPTGPTAYANLAVYLESIERYDEALDMARTAVRLGSDEATAHNTLGICLMHVAERDPTSTATRDEAINELGEALRLFPDYADAHVNLASALLAGGQAEPARQHLETALAIQPEHADAHNVLGNLWFAEHDFQKAAEQYSLAVAARPEFDRAWNNLGVTYMNLGKTARAITCFQEAVRVNPAYASAQANLARAHQVRQQQSAPQ
jgi:protein O-mannosyl-transferase